MSASSEDGSQRVQSIQQSIVSLWQEVLGRPDIDIDANFFGLGGTSLRAMIIVGRVSELFEFDMDVDFFSGPVTVRRLVDAIDARLEAIGEKVLFADDEEIEEGAL